MTVSLARSPRPEPREDEEKGSSGLNTRKRNRHDTKSKRRGKNEKQDISETPKGQFPLQKVTPDSLAVIMSDAQPIGVDPGLKSLVTAVRSDDPADNVQITAGMKKMESIEGYFSPLISLLTLFLVLGIGKMRG